MNRKRGDIYETDADEARAVVRALNRRIGNVERRIAAGGDATGARKLLDELKRARENWRLDIR